VTHIAITAITINTSTMPAITAQLDRLSRRRGGVGGGNGNDGAMSSRILRPRRRRCDIQRQAGSERVRTGSGWNRNDIVVGVGGKQILVEDPSGSPVELFEPILAEARLNSPSK
jgi:hypothetical protein